MSHFQSLSAWFRRLSRRERRVVAAGVVVSMLAVLLSWGVLPLARRWEDRQSAIGAKQAQLAQLRALVESQAARRQGLAARQRDHTALRRRLLTGATPALAASNLQALLQGYADASRVTLTRVDLVAEPTAGGDEGLPAIPVRLSARGDIYGFTALLSRLQYGEKLLVIDELQVSPDGAVGDGPDLLTFSVRLHGGYGTE